MSHVILIVENEDAQRTNIARQLTATGYTVVEAANGWAALDYLWQADTQPQLILLDLRMPVMDGWQFRQMQQQDPDLASIPVVLLCDATDWERGAAALPALATLSKPIDADQLREVVGRYCPRERER